jgi:alpha-galactosidase
MLGPVLVGSWGAEPIADKLALIQWIKSEAISIDLYAVDAGWYGASSGSEHSSTNPWWLSRGDWYPNRTNYPHGLGPLGRALRDADIGFSLWVEPETAMRGSKLFRSHPEWFLSTDQAETAGAELLNLGDPAARKSITKMLSGLIRKDQITWYRQDFNIRPERYWQLGDAPDRIGMTEIRYIGGLYRILDQLLAANPGLRIDNCAGGGRRLDIEMMSRSFVVWRTDYGTSDTIAEQAQTQALAPWVPMTMSFGGSRDPYPWNSAGPYGTPESLYRMRLGYNVGYGIGPGVTGLKNDEWVDWIKRVVGEYREVQPFFYADFYPLAPYSLSGAAWTIWQWDRPDKNDGLVILLRRPDSPLTEEALDLKNIDADALYDVQVKTNQIFSKQMTGQELRALRIQLPDVPSSALVFYRRSPALTNVQVGNR